MTPNGWRNLSSVRYKTRDPEAILSAVIKEYPTATEEMITDTFYSYWLSDTKPPRLIGLAWQDTRYWSYVIMSKVAFDIGSKCSIYPVNATRFRILPNESNYTTTIQKQNRATTARLNRSQRSSDIEVGGAPQHPDVQFKEKIDASIFPKKNKWYILLESRTFGPYPTYDVANEDISRLIQS